MVEYKYCVVKMQLPNKDYDEFVCIASCWIVHRRKMDQTVIVNYPTDENCKTKKHLKKKIGDPGEWRLLKAEVKYGTDSYEFAKTFINSRKNNNARGKSLPVINCAGLNNDINSTGNYNNEKKFNNRHSKEKNKDDIPSTVSEKQLRIGNKTAGSNIQLQTSTAKLYTNEKSVKEEASKRTSNSEQKHYKRSRITKETSSSNMALEQSSTQIKEKQLSHFHEVETVNSEYTQLISVANSDEYNKKIIEDSSKDNIPKASTSNNPDTSPESSNLDEDSKQNHDHKQSNHVVASVVSSSSPKKLKIETKVKNIPETQSVGSHPTSRIEDNNQSYNVTSSNITTYAHNENEKIIERRMNYNFGQMLFNLLNIPDHKQLIIKYRDIMDAVLR